MSFTGKHTEEARAAMSAARMGKAPWNKGGKLTQEHINKISATKIARLRRQIMDTKRLQALAQAEAEFLPVYANYREGKADSNELRAALERAIAIIETATMPAAPLPQEDA